MQTVNLKKYYYPLFVKDTFVEVPEDCADEVLESMRHVKIRGKNVKVERAGAGR